jgi:hypothetical protein
MDKVRVYIAGRLNADNACDYIKNVHRMVIWGEKVRRAGFSVYVPGIDLLVGLIMGDMVYTDYFENSQPWLLASHAMFLTPDWEVDNKTNGTGKEKETAKANDIPVFDNLEYMKKYFFGETIKTNGDMD